MDLLKNIAILVLFFSSAQGQCGDWENNAGYCYRLQTEPKTYEDANEWCKEEGGSLAYIDDDTEHEYLKAMAATVEGDHAGEAWIGLRVNARRAGRGNCDDFADDALTDCLRKRFQWIDTARAYSGAMYRYQAWADAEPQSGEACAAMTQSDYQGMGCEEQRAFICKKMPCGGSWNTFNGRCYRLEKRKIAYSDAQKRCERFQANLVSISSMTENNFVKDMLYQGRTFLGDAWIGYSKPQTRGRVGPTSDPFCQKLNCRRSGWKWEDQSTTRYANWGRNGPKFGFFCAVQSRTSWNGKRCYYRKNFVCEKNMQMEVAGEGKVFSQTEEAEVSGEMQGLQHGNILAMSGAGLLFLLSVAIGAALYTRKHRASTTAISKFTRMPNHEIPTM